MKKIFTFLIFAFLANTMLIGQCSDTAKPNANGKFFNMDYALEADRDAALEGLESITYPAGPGCECGETTTQALADLVIQGPIGMDDRYRIRAASDTTAFYGGDNANFIGDVIFNYTDGTSETCSYGTSSTSSINESSITIFPNPVNDQLTLMNGKGQVTIYNVLGQPVKDLTVSANQANIQLSGLLNGQYFLRVLQEDGTSAIKQFSKTQ